MTDVGDEPSLRPVVAIVPAKDASSSVADTVAGLLAIPQVDEVVVVDDGSSDDTTAVARRAGAWVLRLLHNRGKGGAVAAGVALAGHAGTYLLVDADVGTTAIAAARLLDPVLDGDADMTVGVLPSARRKAGFGSVRRLAAAGIRLATGATVQAPLSGQRAVRGELLRQLDLAPKFGLEAGLGVDARRRGARVVEIPVDMDHHHTGRTLAGFAHRARQGADTARALWPRLTSPRRRTALVAIALLVALAAGVWESGRWESPSVPFQRASKVLIFGMPGLRWDDVGTGRLPNVDRLLAGGALGAMTVRTLGDVPSPVEAYATLGAGARVTAGTPAEDATGAGGPILVPGAAVARQRAGAHVPSKPGALGDALHAAGLRTAVVGNADTPEGLVGLTGLESTRRPTAIALMDRYGQVDTGSVDPTDLLLTDRSAPFGERADPDRMVERTSEALDTADVVLVDPGDLDRAADLGKLAPPLFAVRARDRALDLTDALLGRILDKTPPGTLVMVVSAVPPTDEWELTPLVMSGPGVEHGYAHSPSTRRLGVVTLTDVAPTVLASLGAKVPADMIGHALRSHEAAPDPHRLSRLNDDIAFRERVYLPVTMFFIAFQFVAYLVIGLVAARGRERRNRWAWVLRDVALGIAAFPLATFLLRVIQPYVPGLGTWGIALLPLLMAAVVLVARRAKRSTVAPLAWIFGATTWFIVADVVTGGRLQVGALLGYSPQSAGRFFGLGNTTFAVLAACALLVGGFHVMHAPRHRDAVLAVAAFFVLVAVVDGAPNFGADVGGILTLVPMFGLTAFALWGKKLSWRRVALMGGIAVAVVGLATGLDLLRPPDARTHLGRLAADTWNNGGGELWTTISRKWASNVRLLRATPWAWAVPVIVGFLLYVLVVRRRWDDLLPRRSALRIGVVSALAAGVLGFVVNDSGVVVTALVLVEVGPVLALLVLAGGTGMDGGPEPAPVLLEPAADAPLRPRLASPS